VLAHDLRGPLTAAHMNVETLLRAGHLPPAETAIAHRAIRNLDRTDRMIRDLLDVHRVRAGKPLPLKVEVCPVEKVVRGAVEQLRENFGDRFVLEVTPEAAGTDSRWDPEQVRRALWNLGTNAIKYGAPSRPVIVGVARQGDCIALRVHNEGNPLSREQIERMFQFQPFERAGAEEGDGDRGWGLGLTLVHATAMAHGGGVDVESDEAQGTTFTMWLPIVAAG
jgi:signal transduction histidine kinase